jgi:heme-degrading monooxygenase HmoA
MWHGKVPVAKAAAYHQYLLDTGLKDYAETMGNCGLYLLKREEGDITHYHTLSFWDNVEAIKAFAGEDYKKARYYPGDKDYLLEFEPEVSHYEVAEQVPFYFEPLYLTR